MNADTATEQAQHKIANDAITDMDFNSVIAREQGSTMAIAGKSFTAAASLQTNLFNHFGAVLAGSVVPKPAG